LIEQNAIITGGSVAVYAKYIDINRTIRSGRPTDRVITIHPSIEEWISQLPGGADEYVVPREHYSDSIEQAYGSQYDDPTRNYAQLVYRPGEGLFLQAIDASGGGLVHLDGRIISTNPFGQIQVIGGTGHVSIDNPTNLHLTVSDVYAGSGAQSEVRIFDRQRGTATWYVFTPGQGTMMYEGSVNDRDYSRLTGRRLDTNTDIFYQPQPGLRYEWHRSASVTREVRFNSETGFYGRHYYRACAYDGDPNQHWQLILEGVVLRDPNLPDIYQERSGYTTRVQNWTFLFTGYHRGTPGHGDGNKREPWTYKIVTGLSMWVTTSVRADNPFRISFEGHDEGRIDVYSPAGLTVAGTLFNPTGHTSLIAAPYEGTGHGAGSAVAPGVIRQTADALIVANSLTMEAMNGIGAPAGGGAFDGPMRVELGGGALHAETVSGDVVIDVVGGGVQSGAIATGAGDVVLSAAGSVLNTSITSRDVALFSRQGALGAAGAPLV